MEIDLSFEIAMLGPPTTSCHCNALSIKDFLFIAFREGGRLGAITLAGGQGLRGHAGSLQEEAHEAARPMALVGKFMNESEYAAQERIRVRRRSWKDQATNVEGESDPQRPALKEMQLRKTSHRQSLTKPGKSFDQLSSLKLHRSPNFKNCFHAGIKVL